MAVCIPPQITEQIKANIPAKAMRSLAGMTKENQEAYIASIVDAFEVDNDTKGLLKMGLEQEVLMKQKDMLKSMVKGKDVSPTAKKTLSDKIDQLDRLNGFDDNFIEEVVEAKLGARLEPEQAKEIVDAVNNLKPLLDKDGNPILKDGKYTPEFGEAIKAYKEAIRKANPSSFGQQVVSTGNANLLFNVKSSITNIVSNTSFAMVASVDRTADFGTPYKFERAFQEAIEDAKFYAENGFDVTRAENIDENIRILGETMVQFGDRNAIEKLAGNMNKLVYQYALSTPDQFYASLAKRDTIYRMARNKVKELDPSIEVGSEKFNNLWDVMVEDALKMNPQTEVGIELKDIAVAEANRVTFQNKSILAEKSVNIRRQLDDGAKEALIRANVPEKYAEAFKPGTYIVPFAMTPANVINVGLDYSGLKLPFTLPKATMNAFKNANNKKEAAGILVEFLKDSKITRPAIGIGAAFAAASFIPPEDYIGEYPTSARERELLDLRQATTNSVRISLGGQERWVSLDYLGPVGAALVGVMELKKQKDVGYGAMAGAYLLGAGKQVTKIPLIEGVSAALKNVSKSFEVPFSEAMELWANSALNFVASRTVPAIVTDVTEAADPVARDTRSGQYTIGVIPLDPAISKIPYFRQMLDERVNVLGETTPGQGINEVLFGSRVKEVQNDAVVDVLTNLSNQGFNVTPTDYIENKVRRGDIPEEAKNDEKREYGTGLKEALAKTMTSPGFSGLTPEEQAERITKAETDYKNMYRKKLETKY